MKLKEEILDAFEGRGVEYMVQDLDDYKGKRVLIVGGGDSAVDWALALEPIARQVILIHRREGFRAHDSSVNALKTSSVDVRLYYELRRVEGKESLERAVIFDNRTQDETSLDLDAVILALGFKADLGPIREWGLETVGRRYVKVSCKGETNLPGVFAAGDVALQESQDPLNLIVIGDGQVTAAVNYAYTLVRPGGKVFPGHSSEKMAGKKVSPDSPRACAQENGNASPPRWAPEQPESAGLDVHRLGRSLLLRLWYAGPIQNHAEQASKDPDNKPNYLHFPEEEPAAQGMGANP